MQRRHFIGKASVAALGAGLVPSESAAAFMAKRAAGKSFAIWQLPSQIDTIGNSYVLITPHGKLLVMDGGVKEEAPFLRGVIAALGNEVEAWFVSHPHDDHMGALTEIIRSPAWFRHRAHPDAARSVRGNTGMLIKKVYHSEFSAAYRLTEPGSAQKADAYYDALGASGIPVENLTSPGVSFEIDGVNIKILSVTNETFKTNTYNNASMVIRVWDRSRSAVFLGDLGIEGGDLLLHGPFRNDLNCDYLQMAHHGQNGVSKEFYRTVKFSACLWPSPSWVFHNDDGKGYNTGRYQTVEIRELMDELNIAKHYVSCEGLHKI
ncbi:MAG: MBL fold metallo-hydrolase [Bacteroidales bacterium]|jgi:beta-lactamase superfamily II metal-dependent hydrolase|nr:MBL fold metallo-hydrolase [Bacteroidales bacterium]